MKLYHGSPKNLRILKPQKARGEQDLENQKAIFLTKSFFQAGLYAIGKTLKGKTAFAVAPTKLIILGKDFPKNAYVYRVNVNAKKGVWDQYYYKRPIKKFQKEKVNPNDFKKHIVYVKTKGELTNICIKEKKKYYKQNNILFPRIKFKQSNYKKDIGVILKIVLPPRNFWQWQNKILNKYPKLRKKLEFKPKKEQRMIVENYFKKEYQQKKLILLKKRKKFENFWVKYEDIFLITLSEIMGEFWSKENKEIVSEISLNPICPRDLINKLFNLDYNFTKEQVIGVTMHELVHFLWFQKWKKVFRNSKSKLKTKEGVLHISEFIPYVILNSQKFQSIFKYKHKTYEEYLKIKINKKPLLNYIMEIYKNRRNFKEFMIKSDEFFAKHEKSILKSLNN